MGESTEQTGALSRTVVIAMIAAAGALMLAALTGISIDWAAAATTIITEGGLAGLIAVSAGGYGHLLIRRIAPSSCPTGLRVVSSVALGLWMLSTGVLLVGSAFHGLLRGWLWWPVLGGGVVAAAIRGRRAMEAWRIPQRTDGRALLWVVLAAAGAIWLAGASRPPMWIGYGSDFYDVVEYHLQVPREFYEARHVGELPHNCYSYYPLGLEMLFLLSMCLRGGAYEGMYLAKMMHGIFGALAVVAVFATLKREDESRARFSAGLLGTAPFVLYLSWLAMVELSMLAYLTIALLWLRQWLGDRSARSAWCVGLMLGGACAMKYLSVGLVAGPVLAAMVVIAALSRKRGKQLPHVGLVGIATLALLCPWLVRNTVYTANPVFPLATGVFGRGPHWSGESERRWADGHGGDLKPPVPKPSGWEDPPRISRPTMFFYSFLSSQWFGPILMLIAGVAVCVLLAQKGAIDPWNWSLVGVLAVQLAVWTAFTHAMPPRFIVPALAPIALLAGWLLAKLSRVQTNPFRRGGSRPPGGTWGLVPAVVIFTATVGINLFIAYAIYMDTPQGRIPVHGLPGGELQWTNRLKVGFQVDLGNDARFLLIGDAKAFYFPPNTVYATAFDRHVLAEMLERGATAREILGELQRRGVTHIWVDWFEIWRLAGTYGYPAALSAELFERRLTGRPAALKVLDDLVRLGARRVKDLDEFPARLPWAPPGPAVTWPVVTIYAMPGAAGATAAAATTESTPASTSKPGGLQSTSDASEVK